MRIFAASAAEYCWYARALFLPRSRERQFGPTRPHSALERPRLRPRTPLGRWLSAARHYREWNVRDGPKSGSTGRDVAA